MSKLYSVSYGRSLWQLNWCWTLITQQYRKPADAVWNTDWVLEHPNPRMLLKILISLLGCAVLFTVGILIGHYAIPKASSPPPSWVTEVTKDVDESFIDSFLSEVDNIQIQENLKWVAEWFNGRLSFFFLFFCSTFILIFLHRKLTEVPHMATTAGDKQTVDYMLKRWQDPESGLDQAWSEEYVVYLSFPDPKNPNKVTVGESGCWLLRLRQILATFFVLGF